MMMMIHHSSLSSWPQGSSEGDESSAKLPTPVFRSYKPDAEQLQGKKLSSLLAQNPWVALHWQKISILSCILFIFFADNVLPIAEPKEVEEEIQDVLSLAKVGLRNILLVPYY